MKIGLIDNAEILQTVMGGIRGGVYCWTNNFLYLRISKKNLFLSPGMAFASTRILQACPKHNKNRHILYVDANNLYGEFSKF